MIFDCFMYCGERELLEIRLETLGPHVGCFIITEADRTHSGTIKGYDFRLKDLPWAHKIDYRPWLSPHGSAWEREYDQRNHAARALEEYAHADDWVLIGDLDEIPNPAIFADLKAGCLQQRMTQGWANWFCPVPWAGTMVVQRGEMGTPVEVRAQRTGAPAIADGGWHLTYLGGVEAIQRKLRSFAHTEYSVAPYTDAGYIIERLESGVGLFDPPGSPRRFWPEPITSLPEYIQQNREKFARLLREA